MVSQMADDMSKIGECVFTHTKDLKRGVVADARRFFSSVMEELVYREFDRIPGNPEASITHYGYAMRALTTPNHPELAAIAIFIGSLAREREFDDSDRKMAWIASAFFYAFKTLQ
jgi:hypothetical protein